MDDMISAYLGHHFSPDFVNFIQAMNKHTLIHLLLPLLLSQAGFDSIAQDPPIPYDKWVEHLSAEDHQFQEFNMIRYYMGCTDSASIFSTLDKLKKKAGSANTSFMIKMKLMRGAKYYDLMETDPSLLDRYRTAIDSIWKAGLYQAYEEEEDYLAAELSRVLGHFHLYFWKKEVGVMYYLNTADLQDKLGHENFSTIAIPRRELGEFLFHNGEFENAIPFLKQALEHGANVMDGRLTVNTMNTLGLALQKMGKLDSALLMYQGALQLAGEIGDSVWVGILSGSLGSLYLEEGKPSEAAPLFHTYYRITRNHGEYSNTANALQYLAQIQLVRGKPDSAYLLLKQARHFLEIMPRPDYLRAVYENMAAVFRVRQQADSFYHYFRMSTRLNDSLEKTKASSRSELARLRLDHERNIFRIQDLQKEKDAARLKRNFLITAIIMVSILSLLYLNRQRLRSQLKAQEEEERRRKAETQVLSAEEQLAQFTRNIKEKTSMIEQMERQMETREKSEEQHRIFHELSKQTILTEADWEGFKELFEKIFPGFFIKLRQQAPGITLAEQRMAALTRLELSTRQIATILGISMDSVHKGRQRLRQRLQQTAESSIEDFIRKL